MMYSIYEYLYIKFDHIQWAIGNYGGNTVQGVDLTVFPNYRHSNNNRL